MGVISFVVKDAAASTFPFYQSQLGTGTATSGYILTSTGSGANTVASWQSAPAAAIWGNITGTLSSQTDLNTALGLKMDKQGTATTGDFVQFDGSGNSHDYGWSPSSFQTALGFTPYNATNPSNYFPTPP